MPDRQPGLNQLSRLATCSTALFPGALCLIRKTVAVEEETIKDTEMDDIRCDCFTGSREIHLQVG